MMNLECSRCKDVLPASDFNKNRHNDSGHDHLCRVCRGDYMKAWNKLHPQKYKSKYKAQWTAIITDLFGEVRCQDCGWMEEPAVLEWHHRDDGKTGAPSRIFSSKPTRERIYEILTCTPLCPTCHRIRHLRGE